MNPINAINKFQPLMPSVIILLLVNLIAIFGTVIFKWDVFPLIMLYWLENVIIGAFNVARMLSASPRKERMWKTFEIPFFCIHYGGFAYVHGVFLIAMFAPEQIKDDALRVIPCVLQILREYYLWIPALGLMISHGFSFAWNYIGKGEYRNASVFALMIMPYARVVVLHIVIIFAGFLLDALKSPMAGLIAFILLKIAMDIAAHIREHKRAGAIPRLTT